MVASVGNNGLENGVTSPARFSTDRKTRGWVFGVGSEDENGQRSNFSAFGQGLNLLAPGEGISSSFPNARVTKATGTSFATPLMSGALALALSENRKPIENEALSLVESGQVRHLDVQQMLARFVVNTTP